MQPQVSHIVISTLLYGDWLGRSQLDAAQAQFIAGYDSGSKSPACRTCQSVRRGLRLRAAAYASDGDARLFDEKRRLRRAASRPHDPKCIGKQHRLNATERTHLDGNALDDTCASTLNELGDLPQQRLANRQLVHSSSLAHRQLLLCTPPYRLSIYASADLCSQARMRVDVQARARHDRLQRRPRSNRHRSTYSTHPSSHTGFGVRQCASER